MIRQQATRANRAQVLDHIQRQCVLGEDMLNYTEVTWKNLAVTGLLIVAFFVTLHITGS